MTLKVQYYKKAVLVTGAFDVRDVLKSIGGKYVHTLQGWVFSKKRRDAVISRLQSLQGVDVVDETADTAATDRSTASASANANANSGGAMSSSARGARSSASANDDYSDLASLPTPNKDKFADGVPGESKVPLKRKLDTEQQVKGLTEENNELRQQTDQLNKKVEQLNELVEHLQGIKKETTEEVEKLKEEKRAPTQEETQKMKRVDGARRQAKSRANQSDEKKKQVRKTDAIKQHTRRRKLEREKEKKCRRICKRRLRM